MDEHSVPTLAMDWILSRAVEPPRHTSAPQTSAHAPLFANLGELYPVPPLPVYVRLSFMAPNIKLTCVRCHGTSWLHTSV